jgi:hypothetical protein
LRPYVSSQSPHADGWDSAPHHLDGPTAIGSRSERDARPVNTDTRGTFRWYNDYRLPERLGGGVVTVRLHANAEDAKRKFNRAENVRQIPPGDPDFEVLYRRRKDAESINRHLDDTLWLRRAHSVGNRRQLLNMITYALGVNAVSMHVRRQGLAPPQAA